MSRCKWAIFLTGVLGLTSLLGKSNPSDERYALSVSPSSGEKLSVLGNFPPNVGGTGATKSPPKGLLSPVSAATDNTVSVKLSDLPVGKVIQIGDATNGLKFVKVGENQYVSVTPTCMDELTVGQYKDFPYNGTTGADGSEQIFQTCTSHIYKLEAWGAQGGNGVWAAGDIGGYGGYLVGAFSPTQDVLLHVNVGGKGITNSNVGGSCSYKSSGGYNGGGAVVCSCNNDGASGGGATHIATVPGLLSNLSSYKDTAGTNVSKEILIVAAGGGASGAHGSGNTVGGHGGGYTGNKGYSSWNSSNTSGSGGTQTAGGSYYNTGYTPLQSQCCNNMRSGSFGQGGQAGSNSGGACAQAGGGGGWYGGGGGFILSAGGGSGYIASSNLISSNGVTKLMKCYDCATSTDINTYTVSVSCANANHDGNCANTGHGYARITRLN